MAFTLCRIAHPLIVLERNDMSDIRTGPVPGPLLGRLDSRTENAIEEFRGRSVLYDRCNCQQDGCRHFMARERALAALRAQIKQSRDDDSI